MEIMQHYCIIAVGKDRREYYYAVLNSKKYAAISWVECSQCGLCELSEGQASSQTQHQGGDAL